jgi:hypothetical protein
VIPGSVTKLQSSEPKRKEIKMGSMGWQEIMVIAIIGFVITALVLFPWFIIYKKIGYSPAMGCLMFIPLVNVIMLFVLAFSQWPIERELQNARGSRQPEDV